MDTSPPTEPEAPAEPEKKDRPRRSVAWPIAFVLVAALGVAGYLGHRFLQTTEEVISLPERAASGLGRLFKSDVHVENNSFVVADQSIAEFAVMERQLVTTTKYETSFLGVKAIAIIKGVYTVKSGYDLSKDYSFTMDEMGQLVEVSLPEAEILSIETESQGVFHLSENILNTIDPAEWEDAYRQNREAAEQEAQDLGLLIETRERFLQRAGDLLGAHGLDLKG